MKQTENHILDKARYLLNTKFFYKGRGRGGIDCAGICIIAYDLPDIFDYGINSPLAELEKEILQCFEEVEVLGPGRMILFDDGHLAIYTDKNTIIHSYEKAGKAVEETLTKFWKNKIFKIYRRKECL